MSIQPGDTYLPVASISCRPRPVTIPMRTKRPPLIATSARIAGLPAPSSTCPLRMTTSYIGTLTVCAASVSATRTTARQATAPRRIVVRRDIAPDSMLAESEKCLPDRDESLYALAGEHLTRVDVALRVDGDHVQAEPLSSVFAHAAHLAHDLAILAIQEPDVVVREV